MTSRCSRNQCRNDATCYVAHRINGDIYSMPVCAVHKDDLGGNV